MRFIYVDESGISVNETVVVVAGVIIDADRQWKAVEKGVEELIEEYVPLEHREGFVFHAKDLYHGSGAIFDRRKYPLERSRKALSQLLAVPLQFQLPIVVGHVRKRPTSDLNKRQRREEAQKNQAFAFSLCALAAESYMTKSADSSEIATLIAENNNETKQFVKAMHVVLKGGSQDVNGALEMVEILSEMAPGCLPIQRIVDTVHFAEKNEAILLQLADACALTIRYFFEGKANVEEYFDALTGNNPAALGNRADAAGYKVLSA